MGSRSATSDPASAPASASVSSVVAAVAAASPQAVQFDPEKELSCSICTDTLFQPLTLLNCLHTFCGACLKEWFGWQASQVDADIDAPDEHVMSPYTCPSCRARVRATHPDAKITTLLEMYLAANPGKGKNEEEKDEMRSKYKPGDDVVPRLSERAEEVRMVRQARFMRLRDEERARRAHGYQRGVRHNPADRRISDGHNSDSRLTHLEHQSSLRSLISLDSLDSADNSAMMDEILRQIVDEGLLEGVDLTNISESQLEELGEMVAQAYRRRIQALGNGRDSSRDRRRESSRRRDSSLQRNAENTDPRHRRTASRNPSRSPRRSPPEETSLRSAGRSPGRIHASSTSEVPGARGSHIQREDLLQAYPMDARHRRRSSDTRARPAMMSTLDVGRASSDTGARPASSETTRISSRGASGSESRSHRHFLRDNPVTSSPRGSPVHSPPQSPPATAQPSSRSNSLDAASARSPATPIEQSATQSPTVVTNATYHAGTNVIAPAAQRRDSSFSSSLPGIGRLQSNGFPEPRLSCDRCGKENIQYQVHYNCQVCRKGRFNICSRCYKSGRGCLVWYGFGNTAWAKYQKKGAPSNDLPHFLQGTCYRRPERDELVESSPSEGQLLAKEPAQKRRRVGAFCYSCDAYAEDFFWKCDSCNDGEWGFCKNCVNQGYCCTHPLLPIAWVSSNRFKSSASDSARGVMASFAPITDPAMIQPFPPSKTGTPRQYRPLTVSTTCDRCRSAIVPNQTRYHCPQCNDGSFELCAPCYSHLQDQGTVCPQDGAAGWRRCPRGHRMTILAFQDTQAGQRRVIIKDLVGGHFLLDQPNDRHQQSQNSDHQQHSRATGAPTATATECVYSWQEGNLNKTAKLSRPQTGGAGSRGPDGAYPPDGGVGKRCWARWSWIPEEGVADELLFPKGAEVTEVLDVSDEWCEGAYAGAKGVFPASYVRVLDVITM